MSRIILTTLEFIGYLSIAVVGDLLGILIIATIAGAQLPTRIVPNYGGGYTIQHSDPTEFPTEVRPDGNGGYIADQLGHQPTYINRDRSTGGYTIDAPFRNQVVPNAQLDDDDAP